MHCVLVAEHVPAAPTSQNGIDEALDALVKGKEAWALLSNKDRADILRECVLLMKKHHKAVAENAAAKKGTYESGLGEEMYDSQFAITVACALP